MSTIPPPPEWNEPINYDDDTYGDRYTDWFNNVWSPWVDQYADAWVDQAGESGQADPISEDHEDTGVCSDESMYVPHAQALVLDYSNEVGSYFWKRGRKQWKRFLNRHFADPVSMAEFIAVTYGLVRANMDIYAYRRARATYDALNSGRVPDDATPIKKRFVRSVVGAAVRRRLRY